MTHKDRNLEIAFRQLFGFLRIFFGLRAEVTLEKETPEFRNVTIRAEIETLRLSWRQLL